MSIENISSIGASRADIAKVVEQIRDLKVRTDNVNPAESNFSQILNQTQGAVNHVNELQQTSKNIKEMYLTGDPSVSLSQVVLASQKSSLAFEALLTMRNKFVQAYEQVMNMPI